VSWEYSGIYGFLLGAQGTSCSKPRGSSWSSPLRSDGSRDDQAGEAGPVEQSSAEDKSLKLRAKGLFGCYPSGQEQRQPDGGPEDQIKGLLSPQATGRKQSFKHLQIEALEGLKAARQRKNTTVEKGKTPTLSSKLEVAEGGDVDGNEGVDGWESHVPITSPCDSVTVSEG
jgi:hypothetical protein